MALLHDMAELFRAELLAKERRAATEMVRVYGDVWQRIRADLDAVTTKMETARKNGEVVSPAWLFQEGRLQTLQKQTEERLNVFANYAEGTITVQQREAVEAARHHAQQLTLLSIDSNRSGVGASFSHLPVGAFEHMVGNLGDGKPLRSLLEQFGRDGSASIKKILLNGVAMGQNPAGMARAMRHEMGGNLTRALTISRTEVMRVYRDSSIESYRANSDVIAGWVWIADLSGRTCPMCIAMNGTFHELSEQMDSHINCRCSCAPETKSWKDLGIDGVEETRADIQPGEEWFAKQSVSMQERILGKAAASAYRTGEVTLRDFVGEKQSAKWGRSMYAKSLKEAIQ